MNYKQFSLACGVLLLAGGGVTDFLVQRQTILELQTANAALQRSVETHRQQAAESTNHSGGEVALLTDATASAQTREIQQLRSEHAELLKLRGEVSAGRREVVELRKQVAVLQGRGGRAGLGSVSAAKSSTAEKASEVKASDNKADTGGSTKNEDDANRPIGPGASPLIMGKQTGTLRRKAASGLDLSAAERQLVEGYARRLSEIQDSPEEFATFQTANIAGYMGWRNDARQEQILRMLAGARRDAETSDLTALNQRSSEEIQSLLDNEEREVFSRGFPNLMGIDLRF